MIALLFVVAALSQTKTVTRTVGTIGDYQIVEVDHVDEETVVSRSVLAGKSKAQLREFYRQDARGGAFLATEISQSANAGAYVTVGHRDVGSLMPMVKSHYFLQGSRFVALNLRQVSEAAEKALPKGQFMLAPTAGINLEATIFSVAMRPEGEIEVPIYIDTSRPGIVRAVPAGPAGVHLDDESPRLWTRRVSSDKGRYADTVVPHPLQYFYPHPCLRRDPREQGLTGALSCLPSDRQNLLSVKSKLRDVGQIGEFRVYEIDYRGKIEDLERKIRTALVGRSLETLYEIWLHDSTFSTGDAFPVSIVMAGGAQPLIATNFSDGGMYRINYQSFFWVDAWGAKPVDFSAVVEAAKKALPKTEGLYQPATNYGVQRLVWGSGTYQLKDGITRHSCCVGIVEVPYTIEEGIAKPVAGKAVSRRRTPSEMGMGWPVF